MSILLKGTPETDAARRDAWLAERRRYVTSTDVPVLFGQGYEGSSPIKLYAEKVQGRSDFEVTERMEIGRLMEPVTIAMYEKKTGRKVVRADGYTLQKSEKYPWLAASLDARDSEGVGLELKNHCDYVNGLEDIPTGWLLQTQTQMLVCDEKVWRLAILCRGSEVKIFDLEAHPVQTKILERSKRFWELVQAEVVPNPEFADDNEGLRFLYPTSNGETIALGDDVLELLLKRKELLDQKKELIDELDLVESGIRWAMGENSVAILPDESKVTWKSDRNGKRSLRYYARRAA